MVTVDLGLTIFVLACRYPSSPSETCGSGGQQHSGDDPLAAPTFICPLYCQQLHCGVQTGRSVY